MCYKLHLPLTCSPDVIYKGTIGHHGCILFKSLWLFLFLRRKIFSLGLWIITGCSRLSPCIIDYMNDHPPFEHKYLWKMKIPLKIKIFMWLLNRRVILTKDNLMKRNWHGCTKCAFCNHDETIEHLFISCPFVIKIWRLLHFTFNISPPASLSHMLGGWLHGVHKHDRRRIRIGTCAFFWAVWNCRNDAIFNKVQNIHFLQVVHKAIYLISSWSLLLPQDQRHFMEAGCNRLLPLVRDILSSNGWQHDFRICAS